MQAHLGGKLTKGIIKNKKRKSKDDDANRLEDKLAKVSECSTLSKQRLFSVNNVKRESRVSYEVGVYFKFLIPSVIYDNLCTYWCFY